MTGIHVPVPGSCLRAVALAGILGAAVAGAAAIGVALAQEPAREPPRGAAPSVQPQPITPTNPRFVPANPADAPPPAVAPDLRPDDAFRPGFIDALGRWLGDSKAAIDEQLKNTQDAIGGIGTQATGAAREAAGAAQQATGTLMSLPVTRVVVGRKRCPVSPNGAPDCAPAANELCRSKGYAAGRVADINSAQKCPAYIWWSGRQPAEGECVPETFVLKAMCQ